MTNVIRIDSRPDRLYNKQNLFSEHSFIIRNNLISLKRNLSHWGYFFDPE